MYIGKVLTRFDVLVQCPGNIVSNMDGEKVMLSVQNGKYYNLGEMGGKIWDLVKVPNSIDEVIHTLIAEYDVQPEVCEEQVVSFLTRLLVEGLIRTSEAK